MTGRRLVSGLAAAACLGQLVTSAVAAEEEEEMEEWVVTMLASKELCSQYRDLKKRGVVGADLEAGKKKATNAILVMLLMHGELMNKDLEFRRAAMPDFQSVGNMWDSSSDFIRECWAPDAVELRGPWGTFLEKQVRTSGCVRQAEKVSEFEGRCFPGGIANALDSLHWGGDAWELEKMYDKNKPMKLDNGKKAIRWPNAMMRTPITFNGLRDKHVWKRGDSGSVDHVRDLVEKNADIFRDELKALKDGGHFKLIFQHLIGGGHFEHVALKRVALFEFKQWDSALCKVAPKTCDLLRDQLPGAAADLPYVSGNHEEVSFYHFTGDTHLLPHNGGHNGRINIQLVLEGGEGAELKIHTNINETMGVDLNDKEPVAFSDGWTWETINGPGDLYVFNVGVMHPDIDGGSYGEAFNGKTMWETFKDGKLAEYTELAKKKRAEKKARKEAEKKKEAAGEEL